MSSHHVVREKQEPALLIANGEACSSELLGQLLEWSPFIVVLDGAVKRVMELGIKFDVVLGDFDQNEILIDQIRQDQFPVEVIHSPDQEKTDFEKGIEFLIERGFPAVNIIWATGRRMDHTFANLLNLLKYKNEIRLVMLDDHSKIYPLLPEPVVFEKWYKAGTPVSLLPVCCANGIKTENLLYPLSDESLVAGKRLGNSNECAADGPVKISFRSGDLFLMECID